jgi:hypothetical protein
MWHDIVDIGLSIKQIHLVPSVMSQTLFAFRFEFVEIYKLEDDTALCLEHQEVDFFLLKKSCEKFKHCFI